MGASVLKCFSKYENGGNLCLTLSPRKRESASPPKRIGISAKENEINVAKRSRVRGAIKKFQAAVEAKDFENAEKLLREAISLIDCAKNDGIYKAETASRKIGRLSKQLDKAKKAE